MALKPGTPSDFQASMAEAIQNAFLAHWREVMGSQSPPEPNNQMKLLFIAIAEGVVSHLRAHPEAFEIRTDYSGSQYTANVTIH